MSIRYLSRRRGIPHILCAIALMIIAFCMLIQRSCTVPSAAIAAHSAASGRQVDPVVFSLIVRGNETAVETEVLLKVSACTDHMPEADGEIAHSRRFSCTLHRPLIFT